MPGGGGVEVEEAEGGREDSGDTIWASMGLCCSYNTPVRGKSLQGSAPPENHSQDCLH